MIHRGAMFEILVGVSGGIDFDIIDSIAMGTNSTGHHFHMEAEHHFIVWERWW